MNTIIRTHKKVRTASIIRVEDASLVHDHVFEDFAKVKQESQLHISPNYHPEPEPETAPGMSLEDVQLEVQQAYDNGFNDGKQVTSALLETEMNTLRDWVQNLDTAIIEMQEQFKQQIDLLEKVAVELAITATQHILQREVHENAMLAVEQVKKAISGLHGIKDVTIRIHPSNYQALTAAKNSLASGSSSIRNIHLVNDPQVEPGGSIIETGIGTIDAQLKTQLAILASAMQTAAIVQETPEEF